MTPFFSRTIVLFLCLTIPSCFPKIPRSDHPPEPIGFSEIGNGNGADNLAGPDKLLTVIQKEAFFKETYLMLTKKPAPPIDFTRYTVLLVRMGTCKSAGYGIEIADVLDHEKYVEVRVLSRTPGKSCINALSLTRPYQFVKIPRTEKQIVFSESLVVTECK